MMYAQVIIIESAGKEVQINLKKMLDIKQIYDIFLRVTGQRCLVSLSKGVARVNLDYEKLMHDTLVVELGG